MATNIGQYVPVFLPGESPSLTEKLGRPQSTGSQRVQTQLKWPCADRCRTFFCLWQRCHSESWAWRCHSCLASGDPGGTKYVGTWTASTAGVMALSVFFFCLWQLYPSEGWAWRWCSCLAWPWQHQVCRDMDCLHCRSYGPIRVFFSSLL